MERKRNIVVLVCGGRDYTGESRLVVTLDRLHAARTITRLITGACATGADALAEQWARDRGVPYCGYPAQWEQHGRAAGPIRNAEMLVRAQPDVVVAFPGGAGTAHMVRIAREAEVPVLEA